jgi:hypothetical protein
MQTAKIYNLEKTSKIQIKHSIKQFWHHLTDEEIDANEERRDEFFLAVRKKHGVPRAEAALILKDIHDRTF